MNLILDVWKIFDSTYRKKFFFIVVLAIIGSFLEVLGIGLIIPVISIIFDENIYNKYEYLNFLSNFEKDKLITYSLIVFVFVYLFKNLYLLFAIYKQSNFVFSLKHKLMNKLFIKYLSENYEFHINANPNILYRNIHNESSVLALNILQPLILIFTDCIFFILVITFLFIFFYNRISYFFRIYFFCFTFIL